MGTLGINGRYSKGGNRMNMAEVTAITFAIQSFVTLFVIFDPPGAAPIFLGLVADRTPKERRKLAVQAASVSLFVISFFAIFGQFILDYLHISIASLQAAGGLLLLLVSLELLTGKDSGSTEARDKNVALVPLGTPLLAGPGAIVATMIFVQQVQTTGQAVGLVAAVLAVHVVIALVLISSTTILKVIKESGVNLVARIAGLLLAAISVQMLVDAIRAFIAQ